MKKSIRKKIYYIILTFILSYFIMIGATSSRRGDLKKVRFLMNYFDCEESAVHEIKSADFFGLDWLKTSAQTIIESGCNKKAISYKRVNGKKLILAYGYKQIAPCNLNMVYNCIKNIVHFSNGYSKYSAKLQFWGGNFLMRDILNNLAPGTDIEKYNNALLIYNMGYQDFKRKGPRSQNHKYVEKWSRWYTKLETEWRLYK